MPTAVICAPDHDWRPILMVALGAIVVLGTFAKGVLRRLGVPALVGYLVLGMAFAAIDGVLLHLPDDAHRALDVLADLGIVCLLFRVGLDSDLRVLLRELPLASVVLVANVALSMLLGYAAAVALGFGAVAAAFAAVALAATSIAVATTVWGTEGLLRTRAGALVVDVAELDDIVSVLLMVVLLAAIPALTGAAVAPSEIVAATGGVLLRFVVFGAACWAFARHAERRLTASFRRLGHASDPMLTLVGIAIVVAAAAAWLGFSLAVGALFAGLVFSSDPRAVRIESSFEPVHDLLAPFFFVAVGAQFDFAAVDEALLVGAVLLVAAVAGKFFGTLLGLLRTVDARTARIVAISMVPRAEIALFVVDQGHRLAPDHVPAALRGGMVLVVAATCLGTPPVLRRLLLRDRRRVEGPAGGL